MLENVPVGIIYYESAPKLDVSEFAESLARDGVEVQVQPLGPSGAYAAVEWLIPTVVAVVLSQVSAGFFQAAGEDAYRAFKKAVVLLGSRMLGTVVLIRAGEARPDHSDFSPALSFVVLLPDGWHLKVLLRDSYDAARLEAVLDRLFEQLSRLDRGELTDLFDTGAIPAYMGHTVLARYDDDQDALLVVDPVVEARRRKS